MTRMRYTMSACSQGKLYTQHAMAALAEKDVHRWIFVENMDPETESLVRKWLFQHLDGFYCDLQVMYTLHLRLHTAIRARTHIVLQNTPPLTTIAQDDEAVEVDARGLTPSDTAKALIKATGLNPQLSVYGWPLCLNDLKRNRCGPMKPIAFFDCAVLATLPGRRVEPAAMAEDGTVRSGAVTLYDGAHSPYAHSICVQPHVEKRKPFTVGVVRLETYAHKATLTLMDRLSNPLIEVDAVIHKELRPNAVCDLGYGVAPGTAIDTPPPPPPLIPDYHVLWPGKPTVSTIATFVEDYAWFEAFSEEGCATGVACTPAPHMQDMRKEGRG